MKVPKTNRENECAHCLSDDVKRDYSEFDGDNCYSVIICRVCSKKSVNEYEVKYKPFESVLPTLPIGEGDNNAKRDN